MKSRKKALSLGSGKSLLNNPLAIVVGGVVAIAAIGAIATTSFLSDAVHSQHTAHANFANSSNSIYPVHDIDVGDSMNAIVPLAPHSGSSFPHPHHHMMSHGPHRSFGDYTNRSNSIPTPFVEINVPLDTFNKGAMLSNVIDKCAYVQTYDGNNFGGP
jgi:hypothetical protein